MGAEVALKVRWDHPLRQAKPSVDLALHPQPALHPEDAKLDGLKSRLEAMEEELKETREVHDNAAHEPQALPPPKT
jgi:hypothetical protein